ncbi:WecB/TagA/CpsF family glycosyltransferase [Pirellulaceae bacterium SH501]
MIDQGKKNLLGVLVDALDYEAAVDRFTAAAISSERYATTALAVHGVMTGALDPTHRYRLNQFEMIVPDGMPVRWGLNFLHRAGLPDRVYGPTLMLKLCERAASEKLPIFLFGSDAEILSALEKSLQLRFPALQIAGSEPSQFRQLTNEESDQLAERIRASGAKMTFVGLGCPRQEIWVYEMADRLYMPLFAVGAAFPFHAGKLPQAPAWMQRWGLEWLFRLTCEPKRLWRRYLYLNPAYLWMLAMQKIGIGTNRHQNTTPPSSRCNYG